MTKPQLNQVLVNNYSIKSSHLIIYEININVESSVLLLNEIIRIKYKTTMPVS